MKPIKKILYLLCSFFILLIVGLFFGSIDSPKYNDLGLLDHLKDIPDNKNGFSLVSYTQPDDFQLFKNGNSTQELRQHVYYEKWNSNFVTKKIADGSEHMERVISSLNYPHFKFPESNGIDKLPNYLPIMDIFRLLIIKSIHDAKRGNIEQAIEYIKYATTFSQKIKTESNYWLISHMIGLAMQHEALISVHYLATEYKLNNQQYTQLLAIFNHIHPYHQDSFPLIFSGEFVFSKNMIDMIIDRPFNKRWEDYWDNQDWWNTERDDLERVNQTAKENAFYFLLAMFPKYYLHKNRSLDMLATRYSMLSKMSEKYCSEVNLPEEGSDKVKWFDLIKPNALMDQWRGEISTFQEYYSRRCFSHAHIESVKSIVAIMQYKQVTGDLPENLSLLVPKYLTTIPIDPFDGSDLKYSKSKGYLYSIGVNFEDNSGSTDAYYIRQCENSEQCSKNPTFPIFLNLQ